MSRVVIFKGKIPEIIESAHTPDYAGRRDAVVNPDLSEVDNIPMKYWKKQGNAVVAMTFSERDIVDTMERASLAPRAEKAVKVDTALKTIGITLDDLRSVL